MRDEVPGTAAAAAAAAEEEKVEAGEDDAAWESAQDGRIVGAVIDQVRD